MWLSPADASADACTRVVLDLEWVQSGKDKLIWQIAAITYGGTAPTVQFNRFVLPACARLPACQTQPALCVDWLLQRGAVPAGMALRDFAAFVARLPIGPVLVIAHGCFASDMPVLRAELAREGVSLVRPLVFMDSLHFFRFAFRDMKMDTFSLAALAGRLLTEEVQHDALNDCAMLLKLLHAATARNALSGPAYFLHETPLLLIPCVGVGTVLALNQLGVPDTASSMALYIARGGSIANIPCSDTIMRYLQDRCRPLECAR
jgi:hypothetical protein